MIVGRAVKYTLFEGSKELAFVPLSREEQLKGKLVIDGVVSRMGRAAASLIQQLLFFLFLSLGAMIPALSLIVLGFTLIWLRSIYFIGNEFQEMTDSEAELSLKPIT